MGVCLALRAAWASAFPPVELPRSSLQGISYRFSALYLALGLARDVILACQHTEVHVTATVTCARSNGLQGLLVILTGVHPPNHGHTRHTGVCSPHT